MVVSDRWILDRNVLLAKFISNYIRGPSSVFSKRVRISMRSYFAFHGYFCQQSVCLYNKNKITRGLEDIWILFSRVKHFTQSRLLFIKYCSNHSNSKIKVISSHRRVISSILVGYGLKLFKSPTQNMQW